MTYYDKIKMADKRYSKIRAEWQNFKFLAVLGY
jgi:hypothetical protein